jgi:hypothetical protein
MANIPRLRTVHRRDTMQMAWTQPLAMVYWQYTIKLYCYYKLVSNVIRAVKIHVLSYPWYTVSYSTAVSQSAFRA